MPVHHESPVLVIKFVILITHIESLLKVDFEDFPDGDDC